LVVKGGKGRVMGQVNELWGVVEEIRKRRRMGMGETGREGWLDEKALGEIASVSLFWEGADDRFWRLSRWLCKS
jgi:hypothetical protein